MMNRVCFVLHTALAIAAPLGARPPVRHSVTAPAKATDWSKVASATAAGGFVMGNPAAKVKLIEYGSLTCSHCRHFDGEGVTPLIANYVRSGKVSWEFRSFLLNGFDIPATLTASCNGAARFFPLLRALYAAQPDWVAKMQAIPADRLEAIRKLSPPQQFAAIGEAAGFPVFAAAHGVPAGKIGACLSNETAARKLAQGTADAANEDHVNGTPTFMVNGVKLDYSGASSVWGAVQARLDAALRG